MGKELYSRDFKRDGAGGEVRVNYGGGLGGWLFYEIWKEVGSTEKTEKIIEIFIKYLTYAEKNFPSFALRAVIKALKELLEVR